VALERIITPGTAPAAPGDRAGAPAAGGAPSSSALSGGPAFSDLLLDALQEANQLQSSADRAIQGIAAGDTENVAEVMTAVEKADLAFRTLMQVRNKLVDAYEELMRLRI